MSLKRLRDDDGVDGDDIKEDPFFTPWQRKYGAPIWFLTYCKYHKEGTVFENLPWDIALIIARMALNTPIDFSAYKGNIFNESEMCVGHSGITGIYWEVKKPEICVFKDGCQLCARPVSVVNYVAEGVGFTRVICPKHKDVKRWKDVRGTGGTVFKHDIVCCYCREWERVNPRENICDGCFGDCHPDVFPLSILESLSQKAGMYEAYREKNFIF